MSRRLGRWGRFVRWGVCLLGGLGVITAGNGLGAAPPGCGARLPTDPTSLQVREADIPTTLRLLAQQYRISLVVTNDVKGTVTLNLFDVPVRDVFSAILDSAGLFCAEHDGVLRVSTGERVRKDEQEQSKADQVRNQTEAEVLRRVVETKRAESDFAEAQARGPLREETIRLSYADAEEVAKTLQGILGIPPQGLIVPPAPLPGIYAPQPPSQIPEIPPPPSGPETLTPRAPEALGKGLTIKAHKPTNSVFLRLHSADLERIKTLIRTQLDIPLPQVQIAAQMVVTSRNALEQLGVQWGGAIADHRGNGPTLVGTGFARSVNPQTGLPAQQSTGTGITLTPQNPNFTGSTLLPVDPGTGLPTGGSLVNLPTAFLPTAANPALGLLFGIVSRNFNINLAIQALEVQGKARSIAEPKIVTVEHSKAVISRGFEVPYVSQTGFGGTQVQFKDALLRLEVTPNVIREGNSTRIRMKVIVENNEPDFTRTVLGNPPIFKRRADAEVVVGQGERLVIGGVLIENQTSTVREVPGLGRIPLLGWLFKSRELSSDAQELVVIITPTVIAAVPNP